MRGLRVQTQPDGELQDRDAVPAVLRWGRWVTLPEAQRVSHQPRETQGCRYRSIGTRGRGPLGEGRLEREDLTAGALEQLRGSGALARLPADGDHPPPQIGA